MDHDRFQDANLQELSKQCMCPDCASYTRCSQDKGERFYCVNGRSNGCIKEKVGCLCPGCPVTAALKLDSTYFCTEGSH